MSRSRLLALVIASALLGIPSGARAAIVTNGGFETGDLTGWTVNNLGPGAWNAYTGSGVGAPPPPQGSHAAITTQSSTSRQILFQDVTLPAAGSLVSLSLFVYYHSVAAISSPDTLDPTTDPNQQYRIDVMKPSAALDSVAPGDILATVFRTQTGAPQDLAPIQMTKDLSAFAGQAVRLRFAVVVTENVLNAGVDAVSVNGLDVGKAKLNKEKGTAKLPVTVTDAGTVTLTGKGVKQRSAPASKSVSVGPGTSKLVVKPKGKTKSKLNDRGKAKVKVTITYTPSGSAPLTEQDTVKLKKNV